MHWPDFFSVQMPAAEAKLILGSWVMVEVAWPCGIHTEVHPPATKSVIVAVHEFFFTCNWEAQANGSQRQRRSTGGW